MNLNRNQPFWGAPNWTKWAEYGGFPLSLFYLLRRHFLSNVFSSRIFCPWLALSLDIQLEASGGHGAAVKLSVALCRPLSGLQGSNQPELSLDLSPSDEAVSLLRCQKSGFPSFHFSLVLPQFVLFRCQTLLATQDNVQSNCLSLLLQKTGPIKWFVFASVTV